MKKIILAVAIIIAATVANVSAQEAELQPTQLGKWSKPAKTSVEAVDTYVNACADMYQEAMDIRQQFDAIEAPVVDAIAAADEALGVEGEDTYAKKRAEYDAVIDRISKQQEAAQKIPDLAVKATESLGSAGLKAIAAGKAVKSTKDVIVLVVKENADVLKAAQAQLASLVKPAAK